jgi:hypothetical protein
VSEDNTEVLQILIRQIGEDAEIDSILSETLRVLGHAKFFEPIGNLLHRLPLWICDHPSFLCRRTYPPEY